jgi:hypothetical protein
MTGSRAALCAGSTPSPCQNAARALVGASEPQTRAALVLVLALASTPFGTACEGHDDTILTRPVEPAAAPPAETADPGPVLAPTPLPSASAGVEERAPAGPTNAAPKPAQASPPQPIEPAPSTHREPTPGGDACSPVTLLDHGGARAALVPFEQRCGAGGLTRAGSQALVRVPYLQRLSDTAVDVVYKRMSGGASDVVEITSPDGTPLAQAPTLTDPGSAGGLQRLARVEGLSPDTYYCYRVVGLTQRIGFRTAPAPAQDAPVRFAVFGDSGNGGVGQAAVRDRLLALPMDLVLHTGDVAYGAGTIEQFEQFFFRPYEGLLKSVAIFPIPGNHEYYTEAAAPFIEVFDLPENGGVTGRERWYSFDFGDVHFVGLDTERLGVEQAEWLDRDLSESQRPWTVVYFHRPPFASGAHGSAADVQQAFVPVLQDHAVPIVFSGHEHHYERTRPIGGVTYVVTGGGGKQLRPVAASDFTVESESVLHVVHVEVRGRSMTVRALDVTGASVDSFELTLPD